MTLTKETQTKTNLLSGLLLINKSAQVNSFQLVRILRKITGVQKIGHAGTLDPFATGVMLMLVGKKYTKMANHFLNLDKQYYAKIHLGISTDSYDIDGKIVHTSDRVPTLSEVKKALAHFQGEVEQIPPMFSAKKINGQKLYNLARKGVSIERPPARVKIQTTLIDYSYPYLELDITCSKGTYIRSLAADLGESLECGAHLSALTRLRSGPFHLNDCLDQEKLFEVDLADYLHTDL